MQNTKTYYNKIVKKQEKLEKKREITAKGV